VTLNVECSSSASSFGRQLQRPERFLDSLEIRFLLELGLGVDLERRVAERFGDARCPQLAVHRDVVGGEAEEPFLSR